MTLNIVRRSSPLPIQLAESSEGLKWLQILRTGTFYDKRYGRFEITEKMFAEMMANFEKGVRGIVPSVDYAHETDGPSGGWLKKLKTKPGKKAGTTDLFGGFELTPRGDKTLADKDYGYTSADFDEEYVDNETGENHGCVLKGLAFTNRPVIKNMSPTIQLSEEDDQMKTLAETQTELEATKKELSEMKAAKQKAADDAAASEAADKAKKAKKADDGEEESETAKELSEARAEISKMKKEGRFSKMLSEGKVVEAQREAFMKDDFEKFASLAVPTKLSETGHGAKGGKTEAEGDDESDVEDVISTKARKLSEEKKIPLRDAIVEVLKSDKKLSERRQAKFA